MTVLIVIGAFYLGVMSGALLNEFFDFVIDHIFKD